MGGPEHIYAVQHIRKMRGGSQAHLLRASDNYFYICKFQNNPQDIRILVNEYLARLTACSCHCAATKFTSAVRRYGLVPQAWNIVKAFWSNYFQAPGADLVSYSPSTMPGR
jgi:hypothetical protein